MTDFDLDPARGPGLQARVARGFSWTLLDVWGRQALNLGVFVVLANLLLPADFGLVALAAVFVALAQAVVDQGLGDAIIQRKDITRSHVDTAFWAALAVGVALTAGMVLLAGPIATALDEPGLEDVLRVLSLTFVLSAMSSIQIGLLRRRLAFKSLALRTFLAVAAGGAAGIALAYLGFGAWALVGQQVVAATVTVLALWWFLPWRPSLHFSRAEFGELYAFGVRVMGSDVLNFVSRNADNLLIGALLGTVPLGFYAVGYRILETTQQLLISITRKVTFPALAALQSEPERMQRAFFRLTKAGSAVIMPGYIAMALMAPELIVVVFGDRWADSGPVASALFLCGPALSVQAFSGPLLYAAGHPGVFLRFQVIRMVANVIGFIIAVPFGIVAVAAAFTIRGYVLLPLNLYWLRKHGGISTRVYLGQLRGIAGATLAMAAAIVAVKLGLGATLPRLGLIVVEGLVALLTFVATLWLLDRRLLVELREAGGQALSGLALRRRRRTVDQPR
jgi:PST family polysaccharide transporter